MSLRIQLLDRFRFWREEEEITSAVHKIGKADTILKLLLSHLGLCGVGLKAQDSAFSGVGGRFGQVDGGFLFSWATEAISIVPDIGIIQAMIPIVNKIQRRRDVIARNKIDLL